MQVAIVQSVCGVLGGYVTVFLACNALSEQESSRKAIVGA